MGYIEGTDRNQVTLLPESVEDYVGEDNEVRVIDAFVDSLDLKELNFKRTECAPTGRPPFNPQDLLKLYLYGYLNRIRTSRKLERETYRNLEVIWLLRKLTPDFKTIADFRKDNKKALRQVFKTFGKLSDEWNLYGKELVAIDGTKIRACNSKKNNFSNKKLQRQIKYIEEKIDKYLHDLDEGDAAEADDKRLTLKEIEKRIQDLKNRKELYEGYAEELKETGNSEISLTDPDARTMGSNENVQVGYNVQSTVDAKNKLIVDFKVTNNPNDLGELDNMALRAKKLFGAEKLEAIADKGYYKAEDLKKCVKNEITPYVAKQTYSNRTGDKDFYSDKFLYDKEKNVYVCPASKELSCSRQRKSKDKVIGYSYTNYEACKNCEFRNRCTKSAKGRSIFRHVDQDFLDTINIKTDNNKDKYRLRQCIVEHPFGTVKRSWGAYYFLTKGKASVTAEMALTFLAYNMRRVINILGIKEILRRLAEKRELVLE